MPLLFALIFPFVVYGVFCLVLDGQTYAMDQGFHRGSFFPLLILYSIFGYVVLIWSMLAAVFAYNHLGIWPALILMVSAVEALLFAGTLLFFYESYMHYYAVTSRSNYTRWKYAATLSLGLSSVITFVMGLAMTAVAASVDKVLS